MERDKGETIDGLNKMKELLLQICEESERERIVEVPQHFGLQRDEILRRADA